VSSLLVQISIPRGKHSYPFPLLHM